MRNLLLLIALALLGYLAYDKYLAPKPALAPIVPAPSPTTPHTPTPTPPPLTPKVVEKKSSPRELAIRSVEKSIALLRDEIRILSVEISYFGAKNGATKLRAPKSMLSERNRLEYNLALLLVELQSLKDPRLEFPLPRLKRLELGDYASILSSWRRR
jgi:hypothetical protein